MEISVLLPCYNAAPHLAEALDSVLAQDVPVREIIVVDDGSSDDSAAVAEGFSPRVRCDRQPHQGIGATRNRALSLAGGELVAFLDADDLWPPGSLASRLEILMSDGSVDCVGGMVEEFISPELDTDSRHGLVCAPGLLLGRLVSAMLVRRRVFDQVGDFDTAYGLAENVDWVARAKDAGILIRTVEQVVLRRRIHLSNTGTRSRHLRSEYLAVLKASIDRRRGTRNVLP